MLAGTILFFIWVLLSGLGHLGIWVALYNRINATGLNRVTIKRIEKGIVICCALIPLALLSIEWLTGNIWSILTISNESYSDLFSRLLFLTPETRIYGWMCVLFFVLVAPVWIWERPQFQWAYSKYRLLESSIVRDTHRTRRDVLIGPWFERMARLPKNQITSVERDVKRLQIDGLTIGLEGLRIAHLSDIHLTGQLGPAFYRYAIDWVIEQAPDLVIVSGDIVDYVEALPLIEPTFAGLNARLGNYFVLGNHDKRLAEPLRIVHALESLGWSDLGKSDAQVQCSDETIRLVGNELPWFDRRNSDGIEELPNHSEPVALTIGVAHSPDQLRWGLRLGCQLLLCGHTHGGQIRFPILGPTVAPSWYGSRYASGVFQSHGLIMHVSRGLSGVHPYRWGCLPEVSILELTAESLNK